MKNAVPPSIRCKYLVFLLLGILFLNLLLPCTLSAAPAIHTFQIGETNFLLDGKPFVIRCGEIHFARVPREYWEHRLKMCKAIGMNAVCVYLFWNFHEWEEGKFNWSGDADVVEFCKLAQKEGLWVILRPGPYTCAEWEMGGLPWWLLKREGIQLRTTDPKYLEPAKRYLQEVARVLGPLQITRGGPLLMAQVENEYGSYGKSVEYIRALRQTMLDAGFDIPLFQCDGPSQILNDHVPELFQVANFGANPKGAFESLRQFQKTGPLMCGEYYPGWFDSWGLKHHTRDIKPTLGELEYMLSNRNSFSIYMIHGGTSFGMWSGANEPYLPQTSSYDYDSPINEWGCASPKFNAFRDLISKHLQPGESLPEPPAPNPIVAISEQELKQVAPIMTNLPAPMEESSTPKNIEAYNQPQGCTLYRTTLPAGPAATFSVNQVHDFAWVYLDGKLVGTMDRRKQRYGVSLPAHTAPAQLDVLVEAMGRINYGHTLNDRKGLIAPVSLQVDGGEKTALKGWKVYPMPLDAKELASLKYVPASGIATGPAFWRSTLNVTKLGDTFLDMRTWGKGLVWVNGHCLGRYWNIGPTQTMYLPGPWLKLGANEVVVLDLVGPTKPVVAGLDKPILNQLRLELDFSYSARATGNFAAGCTVPIAEGTFTGEGKWQNCSFTQPAQGRYLCIEMLNDINDGTTAAVAEFEAMDANKKTLSKGTWNVLWVDSEDVSDGNSAENALDGQPASYWAASSQSGSPHRFVIDLGQKETLGGFRYLPRQGNDKTSGRIKNYKVYLSDTPFGLTLPK